MLLRVLRPSLFVWLLLTPGLIWTLPEIVSAQEAEPSPDQIAELQQRLAAQRFQLAELQAKAEAQNAAVDLASFEALPLDKPVADKASPSADLAYEIGSDLKMSARWEPNTGLVFATPNKDFTTHLGMRIQQDVVGFQESAALRKSANFGSLEDGAYFRRIRPYWDGTAYDVIEWKIRLALEQINSNVPNLNEVWVGVNEIPYVGSVRIGHVRITQGFEAAQFSTDKVGTFLETSAQAEAFMQVLGSGIQVSNSILDQHATWAAQVYKQDALNNNIGADFSDGRWGYTGRGTILPFYQDDGRHMLHLGLSGTIRSAEPTALGGPSTTDFRARPEIRDQIGSTPLGNSNRLVDTGVIRSDTNSVIGSELFYVLGPASLQAEYTWASINNAVINNAKVGDLPFSGGYVQLSYFLTGENRMYDRKLGRLGPNYMTGPYTSFWWVADENGDSCWGTGAWEVAFRYSYLNLDDRAVTGGKTEGYSYGLNWHLNTSLSIRWEYLHQNVFGGGPNPEGAVDGFGMRTQFFF